MALLNFTIQMALGRVLIGGEMLLNSHKVNMNKGGVKNT